MTKNSKTFKGLDSNLTTYQIAEDFVTLFKETIKEVANLTNTRLANKQPINKYEYLNNPKLEESISISDKYGLPYSLYTFYMKSGPTFCGKKLTESQATNVNYMESLIKDNWNLFTDFWQIYKEYSWLERLGIVSIDYNSDENSINVCYSGYRVLEYAYTPQLEDKVLTAIQDLKNEYNSLKKKPYKWDDNRARIEVINNEVISDEDHILAIKDLGEEGAKICRRLAGWVDDVHGYTGWELGPYFFTVSKSPTTNTFWIKYSGPYDDQFSFFSPGKEVKDYKEFLSILPNEEEDDEDDED